MANEIPNQIHAQCVFNANAGSALGKNRIGVSAITRVGVGVWDLTLVQPLPSVDYSANAYDAPFTIHTQNSVGAFITAAAISADGTQVRVSAFDAAGAAADPANPIFVTVLKIPELDA